MGGPDQQPVDVARIVVVSGFHLDQLLPSAHATTCNSLIVAFCASPENIDILHVPLKRLVKRENVDVPMTGPLPANRNDVQRSCDMTTLRYSLFGVTKLVRAEKERRLLEQRNPPTCNKH